MSTFIKAVLSGIGVTALAISTAFLVVSGVTNQIPWSSLDAEIKNNSSFQNKIGGKYRRFLVGVYGIKELSNKEWWEKSYRNYLKDKDSKGFSNEFSLSIVNRGFQDKEKVQDSPKGKALNIVCKEVYEKEESSVVGKLKIDLWKYCSPFNNPPIFVKDKDENLYTETNQIGHTHKENLLSTTSLENNIFWEHLQKLFFITKAEEKDKFFADLEDKEFSLKNKCEEAYKIKDNDSLSSKTLSYCSIKSF